MFKLHQISDCLLIYSEIFQYKYSEQQSIFNFKRNSCLKNKKEIIFLRWKIHIFKVKIFLMFVLFNRQNFYITFLLILVYGVGNIWLYISCTFLLSVCLSQLSSYFNLFLNSGASSFNLLERNAERLKIYFNSS